MDNAPVYAVVTLFTAISLIASYASSADTCLTSISASRTADTAGKKSKEEKDAAIAAFNASNQTEAAAYALFINNGAFAAMFLFLSRRVIDQVPLELAPVYQYAICVALPSAVLLARAKGMF